MNYYVFPALFILFFSIYSFSVVLSVGYELPGRMAILFLTFLFGFMSFFYKVKDFCRRVITVNVGLFIFLLLICYILMSLSYAEDFSRLNYPVGMLYFFILGIFLSFSINNLVDYANTSIKGAQFYSRIFIIILIILSFISIFVFFKLLSIAGSVFRLYSVDIIGSYQNSGYYASMLFLVINYMMLNYLIITRDGDRRNHVFSASVLYIIIFFFLLLTSILMGSNYAVVSLIFMLLIFLFVYRLNVTEFSYLIRSRFSLRSFLSGFILNKLFWYFFKIFNPIALSLFLMYIIWGDDISGSVLNGVRLFDTSEEGAINSLMSRIEILKNFDMQFSISPIFGNMYSDNMTSGSGTAAHSLALSLLSHTGVIGFLLFCLFFISIFLSLVKFKMQIEIHARIIRLFAFYNIIFVFMFANISNIFYSPFIWFTFGFLGFFLKLRNLNYSHKQDRDQ